MPSAIYNNAEVSSVTVGIDSVEIDRMAKYMAKHSFVERFFSEAEIAEFSKRSYRPEHVAAAFAAKEAFSKAIGTGIRGFNLKDVSLLHNELGKPYLVFENEAKNIVEKLGVGFDVSITHTEALATAVVISF